VLFVKLTKTHIQYARKYKKALKQILIEHNLFEKFTLIFRCPSKLTGESFYWSGEFCDVKITDQNTSDLIKMYITIGVLGMLTQKV